MKKKVLLACSVVICFLSILAAKAQADLSDGLISHYAFEGNADDFGSSGNHGILQGGVSFVSDRPSVWGGAFSASFDGVDDIVRLTTPWQLHEFQSFTISMWVKKNSAAMECYIIHSFVDEPFTGGRESFVIMDSTNYDAVVPIQSAEGFLNAMIPLSGVADSHWHSMSFTVERSDGLNTLTSYLDGAVVGTDTVAIDLTVPLETWIGGGSQNSLDAAHNRCWQGQMDDVRLYDRVLSQDEIQALAVPEPTTVLMMGLGALAMVRKRK